ncbi:hypothetical protein HPB50_009339 [Hyalomma asiaticum]|uniref:Uncharacterized protein n=1 Tax=Hyalomma asiaticum TaxID=266040 RepID=A0ACB7T4F7_HYAAI|nr:hypothetical protein HPB50_009339 [Hyalomma asiaticum]
MMRLKFQTQECDTQVLLERLSHCTSEPELLSVMSHIEGPWAFVYYKRNTQQLWFGRDVFGRRSLLYRREGLDNIAVVSVVSPRPSEHWQELPANGIYCLSLTPTKSSWLRLFPWGQRPTGDTFKLWRSWCNTNTSCPLNATVMDSIQSPFSGALNKELGNGPPSMPPLEEDFFKKARLAVAEEHEEIRNAMVQLDSVLYEAVRRRLCNHITVCHSCMPHHRKGIPGVPQCSHASVAVLFSGGLDCMVIAAMCARFLPKRCPIDLLNVAFEHEVQVTGSSGKTKRYVKSYDTPDRVTARQGIEELRAAFPEHKWNLVEIDVSREELQSQRTSHIRNLIYPLNTRLDDSLGCALWFAARGRGKISGAERSDDAPYVSPARIVFLGMGADEQLGGYIRYWKAYKYSQWEGLINEIALDINRIAERNLGRDDRVVSDHGREARLPYLDRDVVSFLNQLPIWMKLNPNLPDYVGGKFLLRMLAADLGLNEAAFRRKRAMQFGSRVVQAEPSHGKGSDICEELVNASF